MASLERTSSKKVKNLTIKVYGVKYRAVNRIIVELNLVGTCFHSVLTQHSLKFSVKNRSEINNFSYFKFNSDKLRHIFKTKDISELRFFLLGHT